MDVVAMGMTKMVLRYVEVMMRSVCDADARRELEEIGTICRWQCLSDEAYSRQYAIDACFAIRAIVGREDPVRQDAAAAVLDVLRGERHGVCIEAVRDRVMDCFTRGYRDDVTWNEAFEVMQAMQATAQMVTDAN